MTGRYCAYLRKSRKDEEAEQQGLGETLRRHENMLIEISSAMGIKIEKWYREIVSGDAISSRPVMQSLLSDVEKEIWDGVFTVEVERLARGDTRDQRNCCYYLQVCKHKNYNTTENI